MRVRFPSSAYAEGLVNIGFSNIHKAFLLPYNYPDGIIWVIIQAKRIRKGGIYYGR